MKIRTIANSVLDANVDVGLHHLTQVGIKYPDGTVTWADAGTDRMFVTGVGNILFEFPLNNVNLHPLAKYLTQTANQARLGAEDIIVNWVTRKVLIVVEEEEDVQ